MIFLFLIMAACIGLVVGVIKLIGFLLGATFKIFVYLPAVILVVIIAGAIFAML